MFWRYLIILLSIRDLALEVTLETINDRISTMESQIASKEAIIVAKVEQVDRLEGHLLIVEDGTSLMSATIVEDGPQLRVSKVVHSSDDVALCSAASQCQVICAFTSLLCEEVGQ